MFPLTRMRNPRRHAGHQIGRGGQVGQGGQVNKGGHGGQDYGPQTAFGIAAFAAAAAAFIVAWHAAPSFVLPTISLILLGCAATIAVIAWARPVQNGRTITYWDVTGALTLIGISAALLSDPDIALPLLDSGKPLQKSGD